MNEKILEVAPQSVELTYKAFFQYTTPSFEDALLEALEEVIPNKEKVKQDLGITEEVFFIPIPMGVIYPEETIEKQPNESLLEIPMEEPTIEPKVIHKVQEGFYKSFDFSDSLKVKEDLQLGRETLKNFPEINYRQQKAKEEQNKPILTPGGFEEPQRQDKISFTKAQILLDEFPQEDPPQVKVLVYADEEKEGEKKHMADRESPDLILTDGHSRSVKPQIDKAQQVERIERPQPTYFHEPKHVNLHLEEGSVKFTLFGDRLKLFINLKEDFYRQPTALDVQRLVQSLQNLGLDLELLRFNGSNLYSSDHRQGSKRDTREKLNNPSISELSEDVKGSFSLYL